MLLTDRKKKLTTFYYKCSKASTYFCPGSIKKLRNGTVVIIKPHEGHVSEQNISQQLVHNFCDILKRRASTENISLRSLYDEESRRHVVAAGLYPWSTAESLMRHARRRSLPRLPNSLLDLATLFDNGKLNNVS
ncbi:uncharacterized protein LOC115034113 [Acyrthosiphon pisum]|uniref:Uncharacterized protein n=1 Tax=Acyrthosiphon pisum TaxID=7029 RepID=A0A8R2JT47_ACYPI|nr:uncharacterized protein LOC115034113 [Acyrthosiphon pisum]